MTGIIPKEELASVQRWQANSFDAPKIGRPQQAQIEQAPTPLVETIEDTRQISLPTAEDIERIHEAARADGYQAGYDEGRLAAEQAGNEAARAGAEYFMALTANLQEALNEFDQHVADQLLSLAIEIAAQVVHGSIAVKTDLLLPIIREALTALPVHHAHVTLRLNPADAAHVRSHMGEQLAQNNTQIIEDAEINPGGCLVRAGSSEVDATIETRWRRVLESIGAEPQEWLIL